MPSDFQNMVWRLVIVPGTFIYIQNRGLRARSLAPMKSGIRLPPNSQHNVVFLKKIFLYFYKKIRMSGIIS